MRRWATGGQRREAREQSTAYNLIFSAVGVLIGITVVGYVAWSFFQTERKEPCRARYPAPTRFSLTTSAGPPLSPIELQGCAGVGEWGVLDNSKVVIVDQAPETALEVRFAPVPSELAQSERNTNGTDFRWTPLGMKAATAAPRRWLRVQQEIVLNTPGAADGIVRLWTDGDLKAEDTGIELRKNKGDGIIGVPADIGYVR
jgi:hypothetical protein